MPARLPETMLLTAAERREEVVALHARGYDFETISKRHGVSLATSYRDWHRQIAKLAEKEQLTPDQARTAATLKLDGIASLSKRAIVELMKNGEARCVAPLINSLIRVETLLAEIHGAKQVAPQIDVHASSSIDASAVAHLLGRAPGGVMASAAAVTVEVQALPEA